MEKSFNLPHQQPPQLEQQQSLPQSPPPFIQSHLIEINPPSPSCSSLINYNYTPNGAQSSSSSISTQTNGIKNGLPANSTPNTARKRPIMSLPARINRNHSVPHMYLDDFCDDGNNDEFRTLDDEPLIIIRAPHRQGRIHQFLSSLKTRKKPDLIPVGNNNVIKPPVPCSSASATAAVGVNNNALSKQSVAGDTGATTAKPNNNNLVNGNGTLNPSLDNRTSTSPCSIGILLAAISCIFFATTSLIVKISDIHPMELLAARGLIQGLCVLPVVISSKSSLLATGSPKGTRSLILARGILGSAALIMSFISITMIPLADSSTVIFTSPVFVSIFACLCLGEICSWFDMLMIVLTLIGVVFVSKPSFAYFSSASWDCIIGTFCGLGAAMFTALAFIVLRQLKKIHYSIIILWFSVILTFFGSVLTIALNAFTFPMSAAHIVECLGVGICGFSGQVLLTKALQLETATTVAIARTLDIVFAFLFQIVLLHDTPDLFSCLGSILVVSCVVLTAMRSRYIDVQKQKNNTNNINNNGSNRNTIVGESRVPTCSTVQLDQEDVA